MEVKSIKKTTFDTLKIIPCMERLISILLLLGLLSSCHLSRQENAHRLYTVNVDEARKDDFCSMFDNSFGNDGGS